MGSKDVTRLLAERIAKKVLENITDRRGWRQEWDGFDAEIKEEIETSLTEEIDQEIRA